MGFRPILLATVGGILLLLWLFVGTIYIVERQRALDHASLELEGMARIVERELTIEFRSINVLLDHIREHARKMKEAGQPDVTWPVSLMNIPFAMAITDASGRITSSSVSAISQNLSDHDAFKTLLTSESHSYLGPVMDGRLLDRPILPFARRLEDNAGRFIGIALLEFDSSDLSSFYKSVPLENGAVVAILRSDGTLLARSSDCPELAGKSAKPSLLWKQSAIRPNGTMWDRSPFDGVERLLAYRISDIFGVVVGLPKSVVYGSLWNGISSFALAAAILSVVTAGLAALAIVADRNRARRESQLQIALSALQCSTNGIVISECGGHALVGVFCNAAFCRMTGYSESDVVGRNPIPLLGPNDHDVEIQIDDAVRTLSEYKTELEQKRKDGFLYWSFLYFYAIHDETGKPTHFVCVQSDISSRKQAEAGLKAAMQEATDANTAKTLFLANISHEFRTPLNAILGFAELLADKVDEQGKGPGYLHCMTVAGLQLLKLVDDLIDVTHLDLGCMAFDIESVPVRPLVDQAASLVRLAAEKAELAVAVVAEAPLPLVQCDRKRLMQVLLALLNNAVKFTPHGGRITIEARRDPNDDSLVL